MFRWTLIFSHIQLKAFKNQKKFLDFILEDSIWSTLFWKSYKSVQTAWFCRDSLLWVNDLKVIVDGNISDFFHCNTD